MSKHQALDTFGRSGNPVFGNKFDGDAQFKDLPIAQKMTLDGTVNKTGILLMFCFTTAAISWNYPSPVLMGFGAIGGLVLALITFVLTTVTANKNYWAHIFWMPGVPKLMRIVLAPIEVLGMIIKPFSLMIRLYANITAGHIVLMSIIGLMFIFKSWIGSPLSFGLAFALSLLELLVAALQAYIFTMLSALYFGSAVEEHDDH